MTRRDEGSSSDQQQQQQKQQPRPLPEQFDKKVINVRRNSSSLSSSSSNTVTSTSKFVHPSIFRYTCTGKLGLKGNTLPGQARMGNCKGIASQLELVDHWRPMTQDQAIMQFQARELVSSAPTPAGIDPVAGASGGGAAGGVNGSHQSPAASGSPGAAHAVQAVHLSNVLIYPPVPPDNDKDDGKKEKKKDEDKKEHTIVEKNKKNSKQSTSSPPEQKEEWTCYGSTEVDLLVLRPHDSNNETIVGVAPYSSPGVTIRDITSPTLGQERTTTIRLSILEILYQNTVSPEDMMDDLNHGQNTKDPLSSSSDQSSSSDDKKPGRLPLAPSKVYASSRKIVHHMKLNAELLYSSFQDDFPGRTWQASQRIGNEVEKTVSRTYDTVKRVVTWAFNGPHGSGGGGSSNDSGGFGGSW